MDEIIEAVVKVYGITEAELTSKSQAGNLPEARKMAAYLLSIKHSKPAIAKRLNRKRRVIYRGIDTIKFQIDHYPVITDKYNKITTILKH